VDEFLQGINASHNGTDNSKQAWRQWSSFLQEFKVGCQWYDTLITGILLDFACHPRFLKLLPTVLLMNYCTMTPFPSSRKQIIYFWLFKYFPFTIIIVINIISRNYYCTSAGIAQSIWWRTTGWMAGVQFPAEARDLSLLHSVQTSSGTHTASCLKDTGGIVVGREADHSPPSPTEVKNGGPIPRFLHLPS
jgi:hypothetical protein